MNKPIKKINIGVIGVGHLGEHHVKHLKSIDSFKLIGIHDIDERRANSIGKKYRVPLYNNINKLIEACDAISLVTPTETHYDIAYNCLKAKAITIAVPPYSVPYSIIFLGLNCNINAYNDVNQGYL